MLSSNGSRGRANSDASYRQARPENNADVPTVQKPTQGTNPSGRNQETTQKKPRARREYNIMEPNNQSEDVSSSVRNAQTMMNMNSENPSLASPHQPVHSQTFDEYKLRLLPNKENNQKPAGNDFLQSYAGLISKDSMQKYLDPNYSEEELEQHRSIIENMWDYRYWRLVEHAIATNDWMLVFSFIGEFKLKCLSLAKFLYDSRFKQKRLDRVDYRYTRMNKGQVGIFLIDGILIRVAKLREQEAPSSNSEYMNESKTNGKKTQKPSKKQFDKRAIKNMHQEFISNNIMNNLIISMATDMPTFPKIRVPVSCLVSYLGYTFLCEGDTMCMGIETMINGPIENIFQYHESSDQILREVGANLNLKPFQIYSNRGKAINIPFCIITELHEISDCFHNPQINQWFEKDSPYYPSHQIANKLLSTQKYLLNFSKLWPLFIDSNIIKSYGYLRPEIVLSWPKELSNAVFSNIAIEKDEIGELELAEACKFVKQDKIKAFAKFLDEATFFVVDSLGIEQIMHEYGINMKLMGAVAKKFTLVANRLLFEMEMVARVLKKIFFLYCDEFIDRYKIEDLFTDFLNTVFVQNAVGQKFFMQKIYPKVYQYYEYEITDYPPAFAGGGLLHALCYHCGIKMKIIDYAFFKDLDSIFQSSHIIDVLGTARSYDLETCSLKKSCEKFKSKKNEGLWNKVIPQLNTLCAIARVSCPQGTYSTASPPQSYFYAELAQAYRGLQQYEQANNYAELSLRGIPDKHVDAIKAYCVMIKYYSHKKQMNRCLQYYEKALANLNFHLNLNHPLSISVYNTIGFEFLSTADPSKCEKIFAKSFQICQQALGYMHSTSGKILLQLADLPLPPEKTINFLLQALTILENIESDKEKVRQVCMKISEMYYKMGNLTKMIHFARKSEHWKMEVIALEKLNEYRLVLQQCNRPVNSMEDMKFTIEKSFSCYIKLLDFAPTENLHKMFVALKPTLPDHEEACERIYKRLVSESSIIQATMVDFVKGNLNMLVIEIPNLLKEPDFYVGSVFLTEYKDRKLRSTILAFMDILAVVGPKACERIFTEFRKTF